MGKIRPFISIPALHKIPVEKVVRGFRIPLPFGWGLTVKLDRAVELPYYSCMHAGVLGQDGPSGEVMIANLHMAGDHIQGLEH
ncbi:MAG: hypothetical protein WD940_01920 [Patescibacteria group bacterium]